MSDSVLLVYWYVIHSPFHILRAFNITYSALKELVMLSLSYKTNVILWKDTWYVLQKPHIQYLLPLLIGVTLKNINCIIL
jgi:hypothetical protein